MKNNVTLSRLDSNKYPVLTAFIITFILDLFALITIFIKGTPWDYSKINIFMLISDLVFIVLTIFSNPRFKYFKNNIYIYSILMITLTVLFTIKYNLNGEYVVCSNNANIFMWAFRIISILCIALLSRLCSKSAKKINKIKNYTLIGIEGGLFLAYSIFLFINGIFGQGIGYRDVIYCEKQAVSIVEGKSSLCSIESSFNGYSIDYIQNNLFLNDIDTIYIKNGKADIVGYTLSKNSSIDISIITTKEGIDSFKDELWDHNFITLSNNASIDEDTLSINEVYITFAYDKSYTGERLDTWFGKKGDIIEDDYFSTDYSNHSDENNAQDLYWNYENNDKTIMVVNDSNGETIINKTITKSLKATVEFNKVYRLDFTDNDLKYNLSSSNITNYGTSYYATKNTISKFLTNFRNSSDNRSGMTYSYVYNGISYDDDSLTSFITSSNINQFNLTITYQYKIPTLQITSNKESYTYGDNVILYPSAQVEDGVKVSYASINSTTTNNSLIIDKPYVGTYIETVTFILSKEDSSLTKVITMDKTYLVNRKQITVNWTVDDAVLTNNEITYDSLEHILKGTIPVSSFVEGDISSDYVKDSQGYVDADNYSISINDSDLLSIISSRDESYQLSDNAIITNPNLAYLYEITNPTYSININQKEITIDWSDLSFTYDGISHLPSATTNKCYSTDSYQINISNSKINAGTYTAIATITNTNYKISNSTTSYTINPKEVNISWGNTSLIYDGSYQKPTYTVSGYLSNDDVKITQSEGYRNARSESYTSTLTCNNTNYIIKTNASISYTISPKEITISWGNTSFTYNGSMQQPSYNVEGKCGSDNLDIIQYGGQTNVGTDIETYLICSNTNYVINSNSSSSYTINPKQISIVWSSNEVTYNGQSIRPANTISGVLSGEDANIEYSNLGTTVGDYTLTATNKNSNYIISSGSTKSYSIKPKTLTISWSNTSLTYNGSIQNPTYSVTGGCGEDYLLISQSSGNKDVGTYTSTLSCGNSNYQLPSNYQKSYSISKKTLTISWSNTSLTYNGSIQQPSYSVSGGCGEDDLLISQSSGNKDVGTYTSTLTVGNTNYQITSNSSTNYTINKKTLTINWSYTTATYDGNEHYPLFTWSGLEGSDEFELVASYPEKINAGTYKATLNSIPNTNYQYPTNKDTYTYTINKKSLIVNWSYTTATYDGNEHYPIYSLADLVNDDICTLDITYSDKINAGTHTATINNISNNNYEITTNLTYSYVINKKILEVSWNEVSFTYNGSIQKPTYTVSGGYDGDDLLISQSSGNKDVGTYTSTLTTNNTNYQITSNSSTSYSINKKTLTISWSYTTSTYDGNEHYPSYSLTGLVNDDTCALDITYSDKINAGTHTATITKVNNNNYEITTNLTYEYVIEKATIDMANVSWDYTNPFEQDGSTHYVLLTNVPSNVSVSYTNNSNIEAGTYTAKAIFTVSSNYNEIEDMELIWKIVEKEEE